jgi:hypothetical protein
MPKHTLASLALIVAVLCCSAATAQIGGGEGQFGCPGRTQFFANTDLQFTPAAQDAIEQWRTRPALAFDGFDEKRYGFHQIAFYRWRVPVQAQAESEADSDSAAGAQTNYRAALAVRLMGAGGDRWFELNPASAQKATPDELLYMQSAAATAGDHDDDGTAEQAAENIAQLFSIRPATLDPALPLFLLEFSYNNAPSGTVSNRLLLDARSGNPQISKAVQCMQSELHGAACDVPDRAIYDNLRCIWEPAGGDFRCAMTSPFGGDSAFKAARRDFYLFSAKPARPDWYTAQASPDLATLAVQLSRSQTATASGVMLPDLGPVTLLTRYKDLLPGTEQFVFASPGAGARLNAHFSLVSVSAQGRTSVQRIPKWVLSGEKTDETARPRGYTPLPNDDRYGTRPLEDRPGFHALQAVLTGASGAAADQAASGLTHVVYWIGVEAVDGKLVASAVRVASDGSSSPACTQEAHDGTAISIEPQQGMAAATVHVRPPDLPDTAALQPDNESESEAPSGCVWIGGLFWKPGTGFHVRKVDEDCDVGIPDVSITEDGRITVKPSAGVRQER